VSAEKRGRGRPKKAPGESRDLVLQVRLTEAEMAAVLAAVERDGAASVSEWARESLIGLTRGP
jgi:hypothetical protein